jgi:glycosyltransferase involved in cell wall biosynthesis
MRISIDISPAVGDVTGKVAGAVTRTGVGAYTYYLVRALLARDRDNTYRLVTLKGRGAVKPFDERPNVRYRFVRVPPARVYVPMLRKLKLPLAIDAFTGPADVFVFTNFVRYPLWFTRSSIVFVYDLSFLRFPQFAARKTHAYLGSFVPASIAKSDHVVTISRFSKRELIDEYGVPDSKLTVAEPAVDSERFRPRSQGEIASVRARYNLPSRYVLYAGALEPRKNIGGLLRAFESLPLRVRKGCPLVLAGGRGWLDRRTIASIEKLEARGDVVATGYVYDDDLAAVYSGASLFVYPSFYEGWGMPVLEAMACGVPVITSSSSSLPEAAGDAAIMVDPHDEQALAREMEGVLADGVHRQQMVEAGFAQVSRFSWSRSAEKVLGVIDAVGAGAASARGLGESAGPSSSNRTS